MEKTQKDAPDVSYEIVQDGMVVAGASGQKAEREILHYASQYERDGPIEIFRVTREAVTFAQLAAAPAPSDAEADWRRLALQFDGHRMQAIGHLKAMLQDPQAHREVAEKFLSAGPLSGEEVLAERIKQLAAAPAPSDLPERHDPMSPFIL
jgi:hypothetical protein